MRAALAGRTTPLVADYRMNAGYIPLDHWVHGPEGGGRNIGEACHVYDLFDSLVGDAEVLSVAAQSIVPSSDRLARNDNFAATISYADGSLCTLTYTALGNSDHPKERLEVFCDNAVITLDDYKSVSVAGRGDGWRGLTQNKGHQEELEALAAALRDGRPVADLARGAATRDADRVRGRGGDQRVERGYRARVFVTKSVRHQYDPAVLDAKAEAVRCWTNDPCGAVEGEPGTAAYAHDLIDARNGYAPWMASTLGYESAANLDVLDVGCGQGIDLMRFAQAGAERHRHRPDTPSRRARPRPSRGAGARW